MPDKSTTQGATPALYVPVLKWRRAERRTLQALPSDYKEQILPFIEVVLTVVADDQQTKDSPNKYLLRERRSIDAFLARERLAKRGNIADSILVAWDRRPIIVDFTLLYGYVGLSGLKYVAQNFKRVGLQPIINFNLSDAEGLIDYLADNLITNNVCLRITTADLKATKQLNSNLQTVLQKLNMSPKAGYLFIDLKAEVEDFVYQQAVMRSQEICNLRQWAGIIIAGGSMPKDLSAYLVGDDNLAPRREWQHWYNKVYKVDLERQLIFADYATRHPEQLFHWQFYEPTCSLRYTLEDQWWIVKGQKRKQQQYLAAAVAVAQNTERFCGRDYSRGDAFIFDKAEYYKAFLEDRLSQKSEKLQTGNAESWLKASLDHHIAVVVKQLASLQ